MQSYKRVAAFASFITWCHISSLRDKINAQTKAMNFE